MLLIVPKQIADDLRHWHRSNRMSNEVDLKVIGEIES